jgi:hypothetical protein
VCRGDLRNRGSDAHRLGRASVSLGQWELGKAQLRGMGPSQVDFTRLLQGAQGTLGLSPGIDQVPTLAEAKKMFWSGAPGGAAGGDSLQILFRKLGEDCSSSTDQPRRSARQGRGRSSLSESDCPSGSWSWGSRAPACSRREDRLPGGRVREVAQSLGLELRGPARATARSVRALLSGPRRALLEAPLARACARSSF